MREASCLVCPILESCFFEQPQFKGLLGDNLLQVLRLAPERSSRPSSPPAACTKCVEDRRRSALASFAAKIIEPRLIRAKLNDSGIKLTSNGCERKVNLSIKRGTKSIKILPDRY
jgi:hypothetical protein